MSIVAITPGMKPAPKFDIDKSKCIVPLECRRCLQICPQAVFQVEATAVPRLREQDHRKPGTYVVHAEFRYACTLCNECLKVCPTGAITITPHAGKGGAA